ncbi:MAG: deoxyribodipyrimidine photo-lyase [Planctomycetaceae bacterium]|nr:deoxyribodipyrimidine photo-lyase [Planctomycetaceae bacterium]
MARTKPRVDINPLRLAWLNRKETRRGRYVLYWMQASQRERFNHALEYAAARANELSLPLVAAFALTADFPDANLRHYSFMLQGLADTSAALARRGVQLVVRAGSPAEVIPELAAEAAELVTDVGYLRVQRAWRRKVTSRTSCRCVQVESDVVVPVRVAYPKEAVGARVIRGPIQRLLGEYLAPLRRVAVAKDSLALRLGGLDAARWQDVLAGMKIDRSVARVEREGGTTAALRQWRSFLRGGLAQYHEARNDPSLDGGSHMSAYLHFGQLSPLELALDVLAADAPAKAKDAYLEQLIVRRELSMNFTHYNRRYDAFAALPAWTRATLAAHRHDKRPYLYTAAQLEAADTHDRYWNAAQRQMVRTGYMHNTMRMYWGKKILEWTPQPEKAFRTILHLNNKYFLDGRDPNGFAGVAWCFGKHDRPWAQRPVFGLVRYMNERGLERKYQMEPYADKFS